MEFQYSGLPVAAADECCEAAKQKDERGVSKVAGSWNLTSINKMNEEGYTCGAFPDLFPEGLANFQLQ